MEVDRLTTHFETWAGTIRAVEDVSLHVNPGETLGIVGESGSGKTMTALSILGLVPPPGKIIAGSIHFRGRELLGLPEAEMEKIRGKEIGIIFQDPSTSLDPVYTVGEQIAEVIKRHQKVSHKEALAKAKELLELVEIPDAHLTTKLYPHQLSGGMKQRVAIARALSCHPSLLIADEPTTALDVTIQAQVLELMDDLKARLDMSIILITHDMGVVSETCDRVTVLYAGQVCETGFTETVFERPKHPYTEALLTSVPHLDLGGVRLTAIPGNVPDLLNLPTGCRFHPRCTYAEKVCAEQVPAVRTMEQDRKVACHRAEQLHLKSPLGELS